MKSMSDGEVNDYAWKKLMGNLDHVEAEGLFNEHESEDKLEGDGVKVEAHGVTVHIKPKEGGEQTKDAPEEMAAPEDADKEEVLGE